MHQRRDSKTRRGEEYSTNYSTHRFEMEQYLLYAATIRRREKIYFGLSERKNFPEESEQSEIE